MKAIKTLTVLILAFFSVIGVQAQTAQMKPTIVFVHGIWADGSCWNDEIIALQAKGYPVISVQNPLTSLADDVAATKRAIEQAKGDVILVGHSWGGFVITQAGNDPKVKALVYIAAFAPEEGETVPTLSSHAADNGVQQYFIVTDGFISLSQDGIKTAFAADLSPKKQDLLFVTQIAANHTVFGEISGTPAWKQKPSWYIVNKNDKAINPDLERFMAKRINATTTEIESSHVSMLTHPKEVLAVIESAANAK